MSANPRSPESGDVPEKDVAEMPDHLLVLSVVNASFDLGAWNRDTATTPYEVEVLRQRRYVNELHRRLAELSTARARADSAVQTVAFFASCIKSGESWSPTCEAEMQKLRSSLPQSSEATDRAE